MSPAVEEKRAASSPWGLWLRLVAVGLLGVGLLYCMTGGREKLDAVLAQVRVLGPVWFYVIFTVATSLGVPTSPFLLVGGATFGVGANLAGVIVSYMVNLAATYWLGRTVFADLLRQLLAKVQLPWKVPQQVSWQVIALVRTTPGLPYVVQSCLLASVCARFWLYYLVSLPVVLMWACLFVFLGRSVHSAEVKLVVLATFLLLVGGIGLRLFGKRLARRFAGK